jgi:hypothetical protein
MHVDVNGGRLWLDVDGPGLVLRGPDMRVRPTVVLVHGSPGDAAPVHVGELDPVTPVAPPRRLSKGTLRPSVDWRSTRMAVNSCGSTHRTCTGRSSSTSAHHHE